jgi:hypothetical protein
VLVESSLLHGLVAAIQVQLALSRKSFVLHQILEFDHQFAIGSSFTLGVGYHIPLSNRYGFVASLEYDMASRQGEVQGIGDKQFRNSNIAVQVGLIF